MRHADLPLALTFDDVLLVPQRSDIASRRDVDTTGRITPNISLAVPIVAANMDTVTEVRMAIAMAQAGGIGIIHRFLTIEEQAEQVRKVKRAESHVIEHPWTIGPDASVLDMLRELDSHGVNGLPVVDTDGTLLGLVTRRDLVASGLEGDVRQAMTVRDKLIVGTPKTKLGEARDLMAKGRVEKLPIVDDAGKLAGLITMKDLAHLDLYPLATKDARGRLRVGAAVGVRGDYLDRARALAEAGCDVLCLDIAHGHAEHAIEATRELRRTVDIEIIAGNVATAEGARDLIAAGAHGIKVGVGPGSVCTTRLVAGVGVPQLTAIMDVAPVCHEAGIPLCGDGGIRMPADMSKAIGAGADTIMVGNLLAGTSESPGTLLKRDGRTVKVHRGMASGGAMQRRTEMDAAANRDGDQGTPTLETRWLLGRETDAGEFGQVVAEGVEAVVPYRGDTHTVLNELAGGLRSAMSYSNARTVPAFHASASFVRITAAGQVESRPHDVEV
ncbi:MAG: inosine monophosphate dehydrogenase [Thermoleophilia bacterium]|nr:inosine monophosphate dehydrogenase [Thermoleophilia bacterium]MCZ4497385.1 inosine monophosphate dehydrogenase [Thermoleophilia bacterium]